MNKRGTPLTHRDRFEETGSAGDWAIIAGIFSVGFILGAVFGAFVALSVWM